MLHEYIYLQIFPCYEFPFYHLITSISLGISNDDIIDIRGKILSNTSVTKDGIFYMAQHEEKGAPFSSCCSKEQIVLAPPFLWKGFIKEDYLGFGLYDFLKKRYF